MGLIQTAIGQLLGSAAAAAGVGKKLYAKNEGQTDKEAPKEEQPQEERPNRGSNFDAAKAYKLAQQKGLTQPQRIIFDEIGNPVATYGELARLLGKQTLSDHLDSKARTKNAVKERMKKIQQRKLQSRG